ncbi:MAG: ABC transporter permease [Deltaproteobacteria bacterium]|nr:ABC transporter permease [Deltaproteobacteria bacterium]
MTSTSRPGPPAPTSTPTSFLAGLGRPVVLAFRQSKALADLFIDTLVAIFRGKVSLRAFADQCFEIGNRSVPFVLITLGVLGFITVFQVAYQIQQILPDFSMLGAAFIQMMCREFAPTITGLMVATRVGSGIAAEIGSMVVTEQVDALRMCNADPVEYLIAPRTLASGLMMVVLTVVGIVSATVTGMLIAKAGYQVPYQTFLKLDLVTTKDVLIGVVKALAYGFAIPVIAGQAGLEARGGSAGVGWATTRAVVNTSFAVIVLDFLVSGLFFVLFDR